MLTISEIMAEAVAGWIEIPAILDCKVSVSKWDLFFTWVVTTIWTLRSTKVMVFNFKIQWICQTVTLFLQSQTIL